MRVLFSAQVGAGHWRPLAPLARALAAAGHAVAFATTRIGCTDIAPHGFRTFPVGTDEWLREPAREAGEARSRRRPCRCGRASSSPTPRAACPISWASRATGDRT